MLTIKSKFFDKLILESLNFKASNIIPSLFKVGFKWFLSLPIKSYFTKDVFEILIKLNQDMRLLVLTQLLIKV